MARQPIQWRRIYRQTLTLTQKNFLIFYKSPIATTLRALIFPLAITLVLCYLKYLQNINSAIEDFGLSTTSQPVKDLAQAMNQVSKHKLFFVLNGTSSEDINPIIESIIQLPGMKDMEVESIGDVDALVDNCKQTLGGESDCYAAVVFNAFNETVINYSIVLDSSIGTVWNYGNWRQGENVFTKRILPIQWAINSVIGNFSSVPKPSTQGWSGSFGPNRRYFESSNSIGVDSEDEQTRWLGMVAIFVAPVFFLILIGVVYHLATFVATERESQIAELMAAQEVTITPRIASTFLSFFALYAPGFLFCSIIMTQVLFTRTSDILMILLTILAGTSLITASHFLGSFFGKANLAGLYTSTLSFALALITLTATLTITDPTAQITALALVFPPATWATLIEDIALREATLRRFSLTGAQRDPAKPLQKVQYLDGYLYIVFFIVQIIAFSLGTYLVERYRWGVTRKFDRIEASSDVAVRCTSLSKTYGGKIHWKWLLPRRAKSVVAVDKLDLEVKKGSVTFLLGPNGGGKTTTLKCVAGMVPMDAGSRLELNEAGVVFGICPQANVFWQGLSVQQHIKIWRKLKTAAYEDATPDDDDVIAECDLLEKIDAPAQTLSGGQMRKLQLAISFVGGSKVCCIDEASSGLDPLSRRNIWNIIQKGHSKRTVLVTTHFLDEADVLADHIAIIYKGRLVCEGPSTSLKARFGESYTIRSSNESDDENLIWRTSNSAEATRKLLELEETDNDNTYDVQFPTLEQVFLKVTSDTAVHATGGDGFVGDQEDSTVIDEKIFALETEAARDIDLDVGHGIGFVRQIRALFSKRYILLQQKAGWISYGINLIIPIIISAALVKFFYDFDSLQTCEKNSEILRNPAANGVDAYDYDAWAPTLETRYPPSIYSYSGNHMVLLGPQSSWSGRSQEALYRATLGPLLARGAVSMLTTYNADGTSNLDKMNDTYLTELIDTSREFFSDRAGIERQITNYSGNWYDGIGIWSPTPETATLFYNTQEGLQQIEQYTTAMDLISNRIANASQSTGTAKQIYTSLRNMRRPANNVSFLSLPITVLLILAFICATSISVIYPVYERINHVRALQYCNGVSPAALWIGYLLFDAQFIFIQSIFVWGILFAGPLSRLYFESGYLLGIFILFGIATYLGSYVLSLFIKKAAFAVAAGAHVILFVLYLVGYIVNQSVTSSWKTQEVYSALQYGLGLSSPAANLARALWVATNSFDVLCGKYGDSTASPGSYERYGSPYVNLAIQILFLISFIGLYEYGSADWFHRTITHRGKPSRLHYTVEAGAITSTEQQNENEKNARVPPSATSPEILNVSSVSKYFGKLFAVENVSFTISSNEVLALLGGNGAGKTTVINMIRGELRPNFGDIFLDGDSVLRNPHKVRTQMGVCPQDDAVDNLTVRQTLRFYATVKGLKNIEGNVDKVLNALNITSFESLAVRALSGGTKRKLSVAIALLGNPRVLLLDEPSTGQDAGAKRILWRALHDISINRAILLTTHSMEEAEALATNVAIMGTRMLASGTLTSLQASHGGAYGIRAVREQDTDASHVEELIERSFNDQVSNYYDSHGQVSFNLPHDKAALGAIMKIMEGLKGNTIDAAEEQEASGAGGSSAAVQKGSRKVISDYTISGPTLEEVFMNVARESGVSGV